MFSLLSFWVRRCLCSSLQTHVGCLLPCFQLTENCVNVMNMTSGLPGRRRASGQVWQSYSTLMSQIPALNNHIREWIESVAAYKGPPHDALIWHPPHGSTLAHGKHGDEACTPQTKQPLFKLQGPDSFLTHSRWRRKHTSQGLSTNGAGSAFLRRQTAWNNGSEKCVLPSFIALGDLPPSPMETMWTAIFRVSLLIILADRMGTG